MPRSAKTLPELAIMRDLFFVFDMAHLIVRPGFMEPSGEQLDIFACGLDSTRRLLLERMQNVNCMFELDRIHHAIGAGAMICDHFEDARALASPRLRAGMLSAKLRHAQSGSKFIDNRRGKVQQIILARARPEQRFFAAHPVQPCHVIIPVLGYRVKREWATCLERWKVKRLSLHP